MKTDQFTKALAAASAGPIRRTTGQTPGGSVVHNWSHAMVGTLNRQACNQMVATGLVKQDGSDPSAFWLTDKGAKRLAEIRSKERAWLQ